MLILIGLAWSGHWLFSKPSGDSSEWPGLRTAGLELEAGLWEQKARLGLAGYRAPGEKSLIHIKTVSLTVRTEHSGIDWSFCRFWKCVSRG